MLHERIDTVISSFEIPCLNGSNSSIHCRFKMPNGWCDHGAWVLILGVDHVADSQNTSLFGSIWDTKALCIQKIGTAFDHSKSSLFGFWWVKPWANKWDLKANVGIHLSRSGHEGMHQSIYLGDWESTNHSDVARLCHCPSNNTGQVGGILDVVIEDG